MSLFACRNVFRIKYMPIGADQYRDQRHTLVTIRAIGAVLFDKFGSAIEDSPIVDNDTTMFATLGLIYNFQGRLEISPML